MEMEEMKPNLGELLRNNKVKAELDSVDSEVCTERDPHKAVSSSWMEKKHLNIKQEVVADCLSHSSDIKSSFSSDCDLSHADIKCFFLDDKYIKLEEKPNIEHTNVTKDEYTPDDLADTEVDEKPCIEVLQASVEAYKRSCSGQLQETQKTDVTGGPQDSEVEQKCGLHKFVHKFKQEVTPIYWSQPTDHKLKTEQPIDDKLITEQPSQHYKDDTQQTPVVCDLCNKNFQMKNKMFENHVRSHLRQKYYTCKKCKQRFDSPHQLQNHKEFHREIQGNTCEICERNFTYHANLLRHMKLHAEQKPFTCEVCGHSFSRHYYYKKHLKTHPKKSRNAKDVNIRCAACNKHCKKRNKIDRTTKIYLKPKNNEIHCKLCDKHFQHRSGYQSHMKRHEDGQWYACDVCGRGFVIKNDLKLHLVRHLTDNLHQCDVCGKHFSKAYYLKKHKLTHEDDNFLCRSCVRNPAMRHKRKEMRQSRAKPNRKRRRTKVETQQSMAV